MVTPTHGSRSLRRLMVVALAAALLGLGGCFGGDGAGVDSGSGGSVDSGKSGDASDLGAGDGSDDSTVPSDGVIVGDGGSTDVTVSDSGSDDGSAGDSGVVGVDVELVDAGPCRGDLCPGTMGRTGTSLVSAGGVMNSRSFRMVSTLGQPSLHLGVLRSARFVLRGGLVGTIGGR